MNSARDISDFKPQALSGVLVCDAVILRERSVGMQNLTTSALAGGHPTTLVKKVKGRK
jgi:hypothetical protein